MATITTKVNDVKMYNTAGDTVWSIPTGTLTTEDSTTITTTGPRWSASTGWYCLDDSISTITNDSPNEEDKYYYGPSDIKDYVDDIERIIVNDKAVIMRWKNGSKTTAIVQDGDTFNLERGIEICLLKGLLGNDYHKLIKAGVKKYHELEATKQAEIDAKQAQKLENELKDLRRQEDERQKRGDRVYEISQGIKRAVKELASETAEKVDEITWKEVVEEMLERCGFAGE